jgi:hypothetical protein
MVVGNEKRWRKAERQKNIGKRAKNKFNEEKKHKSARQNKNMFFSKQKSNLQKSVS